MIQNPSYDDPRVLDFTMVMAEDAKIMFLEEPTPAYHLRQPTTLQTGSKI